MRPQHITAENRVVGRRGDPPRPGFNEAAAYHCGKLLAEQVYEHSRPGFNEAAAYHCGKRCERARLLAVGEASMRPQHITAENEDECRQDPDGNGASMRPQHITAENGGTRPEHPSTPPGFNEAAAYHCGKRGAWYGALRAAAGFNEAAAYHCGKRRQGWRPKWHTSGWLQ